MLVINIARNGDPSTNKCGVAVPFVVAVVDGVAVLFVVVDDVVVMLAGDDDDDEDDDDDDNDDDDDDCGLVVDFLVGGGS